MKIADCWSFNGRIFYKSLGGVVCDVNASKSVNATMSHIDS